MHAILTEETVDSATGLFSVGTLVAIIAYGFLVLVAAWKMYDKAGQPGWTAIIPLLNVLALLRIVQKPWWWIFLLLIPFGNIAVIIIVDIEIAQRFGKGTGFGLGLAFLPYVFFPILGFGSARCGV